jgi:hypothetical protein
MPDGSNIIPLKTSREVAKLASLRPAPVVDHPQANAFGHRAVEPLAVDQDGGRVLLWGERLKTFVCESNAARACAALEALVDLGILTPTGFLRMMLQASVAQLDPEPPSAA